MNDNKQFHNHNFITERKAGVTLIELLAVIVIIGIIAAISVPLIGGMISRSRVKADNASMIILNEVSRVYAQSMINSPVDIFAGIDSDTERQEKLVDDGFLSKVAVPQVEGTIFTWDIEHQTWIYTNAENKIIIILDKDNLDVVAPQILVSFSSYIDVWLEENSSLPVFNQTYASLTWSSANYTGTSQTNIFAANFWLGYFEYADSADFDHTNPEISDFKVFFDRNDQGTITNEITAIYLQMGSSRIIYFSNGVTKYNTHYSTYLDSINHEIVAPSS